MHPDLVKSPVNDPSYFHTVVCWHFSVKRQATKPTKSSVSNVIKLVLHVHKSIKTKPFYIGAFHDSTAQHRQPLGSSFYFSEQFHFQTNLSYNCVFKFSQSIHLFT